MDIKCVLIFFLILIKVYSACLYYSNIEIIIKDIKFYLNNFIVPSDFTINIDDIIFENLQIS